MTVLSNGKNTQVAALAMGLQRTPRGILTFGLVCHLPGVEPVVEQLRASPSCFDEMTALAGDSHSAWRTWGACFDEVVFSFVPQQQLF